MLVGCHAIIIGTIISGTANGLAQLLASRFFLGTYGCQQTPTLHTPTKATGWGYSLAASAAPAYVMEISHPACRGHLDRPVQLLVLYRLPSTQLVHAELV